jgi:hypothetical protein
MQIPRDVDPSFYQHLVAEDELGMVVRAHIHIEASIIDFLKQVVPNPKLLPRLAYEARLRLACALGLDQDHFDALKTLGDIRNSFGHDIEARLTDQAVNDLYARMPALAKEATLGAYAGTTESGSTEAPPFHKLSARDRFVLIAVALKMFAVHSAAKAHFQRVEV